MITGIVNANLLTIPIDEADSEPLIGMLLMEGYHPTVQVFDGGHIEPIKMV